MPLEMGIFLGAQTFGDEMQRTKVCLVLDRDIAILFVLVALDDFAARDGLVFGLAKQHLLYARSIRLMQLMVIILTKNPTMLPRPAIPCWRLNSAPTV